MTEQQPSFELKRFNWAAPDRLDLAGTFSGLGRDPAGSPSLLVSGAAGEHRLAADADSAAPADSEQWAATFTWREPPVAFDAARLEFGGGVCVELPQPGTRRALRRTVLDVHEPADEAVPEPPPESPADEAPEPAPESPTEALRLQAALLAADERAREESTAAQQAAAELARAQQDLAAERAGRAADAERFRETLDRFRVAAEDAVAAEKDASVQLGADLREAHEELDRLRAQLAESRQTAAGLRSAVEDAEVQAHSARAGEAKAAGALEDACMGVERLLEQLRSSRP